MEAIQMMEIEWLLFIQEHIRQEYLTVIMKAITFLGDGGWFWIFLGIALMITKKYRKSGMTILIALAIGALITNLALKNIVARMRPYDFETMLIPMIQKPKDYSFPSGHTCASFAAAFTSMKVLPNKASIPIMILACLIACSRMYLGVHYPTDILGGILVAFIASYLAVKIQKRRGAI